MNYMNIELFLYGISCVVSSRTKRRHRMCTLAPGDEGVAKRTAQTAPSGATVMEIPFGANN